MSDPEESGAVRAAPRVLRLHLRRSGKRDAQAEAQADVVVAGGPMRTLMKRLAEVVAGMEPAAYVFCTGPVRVPEVGELRFEPEIISPTRFVWWKLPFVLATLCILALLMLEMAHVTRLPIHKHVGSFGYILSTGVMWGVIWVWRTSVRPVYIRLAPGMVQVLRYRLRGSQPTIRSYPMTPGTLVMVSQGRKARWTTFVQLSRGELIDVLPVSQMRNSEEVMQRIWQALLSTAPTPPLSEEELVG